MPAIMRINKEDINNAEKCNNYTVSIIECDEIGAPHACLFSDAGFKVIGVNTNPHTLKLLKKGRAPFPKKTYQTLERHLKQGILTVSSNTRKAASESEIIVIAVKTAIDRKKKPDYSLLEKTCKEVGMGLKNGALVLFVSTTGPGIIEGSMREILENTSGLKAGTDFGLAFSPIQTNSLEKLSEDSPRLIGAIDESSVRTASLILNRLKAETIKVSNIKTVEAINLFQNLHKEVNVALANELAFLCERLKIDFLEVLEVVNKNNAFHLASPGIVNASTRKDFYMLLEEAENVNLDLPLTLLAEKINDEIVDYTFHLVKDALKVCGKTVRRAKVSVFGISRGPNVKEPPGILKKKIINLLKRKVRTVQVYDPFFSNKELTQLGFEPEKLSKVVEGTDCVLILAGHSKFGRLSLNKIKFLAKKSPAIVDIGNVIDPIKAENSGFVYRGLGRGVWTK